MKQEQIHDALNLLDDDLVEAVDALRNKAGISGDLLKERSCSQKSPWMKYMSLAACLCVVILGAFALRDYKENMPGNDKCNSVGNTTVNDEDLDGMVNNDGLTGGPSNGAVGEVPSVLVRIDAWTENGFEGVVAGIVDTDIFSVGADILVIFNENISVGIKTNGGMRFEKGAPDKADFPVGSIVRVQFVRREQATEGTDNTKHAGTIFVELIAMPDDSRE